MIKPSEDYIVEFKHASYEWDDPWWVERPLTGRWKLTFDSDDNALFWLEIISEPATINKYCSFWKGEIIEYTQEEYAWIPEDRIRIRKRPKPDFIGICSSPC